MNRATTIAIGVLCGTLLLAAAEQITGQWMIDSRAPGGKIRLTLHTSRDGGQSTSSSSIALDQLRGLTPPQMNSAGTNVRFEIARDAGTLACHGWFQNGDGSGAFTFSPNANFVSAMQSMGFSGLDDDKLFAMALHDVSLAYVRDARALGVKDLCSDKLIAMRIHGVSIDDIRDMNGLGYSRLSADQLVSMRIHGVSPAFARDLQAQGYRPTTDQMVTLRIHGASTEFVKHIQSLGYQPTIDQLVTMRIHGVTPEFIRDLAARGLKKLTIDQLVSLKIHGID